MSDNTILDLLKSASGQVLGHQILVNMQLPKDTMIMVNQDGFMIAMTNIGAESDGTV
jgi:hypothetical protein